MRRARHDSPVIPAAFTLTGRANNERHRAVPAPSRDRRLQQERTPLRFDAACPGEKAADPRFRQFWLVFLGTFRVFARIYV
jgi:hypothetical protein